MPPLPQSSMRLSIIIPTLDEESHVEPAIESAWREGADEVIVVDGGSGDNTVQLSRRSQAHVIVAPVGHRARQMNLGAQHAGGDILVFLHADSFFEPGALGALRRALDQQAHGRAPLLGGGFRRRYQSASRLLRAVNWLGNARAESFGLFFGDQAIWARRDIFQSVGGFPIRQPFEDLDFSRRLCGRGATSLIVPGIVTSARRFESSVPRRIASDARLTLGYWWRPGSGQEAATVDSSTGKSPSAAPPIIATRHD